MKKIIVIPLLFVYALAISGIAIRAHYCGSHLMSISLLASNDKCGDCDGSSKKKCCKDKVICFQVSHEQNSAKAFTVNTTMAPVPTGINYPFLSIAFKDAPVKLTYMPNAPPGLWQQIPLYKLHSRIVYYG